MVAQNRESDVVVVGSGMAGLVAAVRALEQDADVILLEKGDRLGGTTRVTGGYIAANEDAEPNVDAYEPIEESLDWLRKKGVEILELENWEHGEIQKSSTRIDPPQFVECMQEYIETNGGEIMVQTPFTDLQTDDQGRVSGVVAHDYDSGRFEIQASSVILACGGRSGNEGIMEEYYPHADLWLGRDPWSTGDGYLAAQDIGAKTTGNLTRPVGVTRPAPPAEISFEDMRCGQIYDTSSVAITTKGRRFTDESDTVAQSNGFVDDYLKEVDGPIYLLLDQELYENEDRYQSAVADRIELARELGGEVLEAETIEELCTKLDRSGVNGERAEETIQEFNNAVCGTGEGTLEPPRKNYREQLDTPPYYAVKVIPAVLYLVGGLDIDEHARVLSRAISTSSLVHSPETEGELMRRPIEGLYAAGVEVGKRVEDGYYGGGLSLALGTGRIAGEHAAQRARDDAQA